MKRDPIEVFDHALSIARRHEDAPQPACIGRPAQFVDYVNPPSEEEARQMCAPCPLLMLCRKAASKSNTQWGVQGGIVWANGRQYHWSRKLRETRSKRLALAS